MAAAFHAPIDAGVAIAGAHCGPGGTMNFSFGPGRAEPEKHNIAPFSTVPFAPDPDFVDRPAILQWVRDKCAGPGARAALVGLGGMGKSLLAIQYAHSVRDAHPNTFVFWVHASTRARFENAYRGIANHLNLPGRNGPNANVLRLVSDWLCLETNGQWIMILDNADDAETFFPTREQQSDSADSNAQTSLAAYVPQSCNGAVLVTSRNKKVAARLVGGHHRIKEVLALDATEGLQLLRNKLHDLPREDCARDLLHTLDYIPLAITQAIAYINQSARMTVARYLDIFRKSEMHRENLLNWDAGELRRDQSTSNSVVITWQMSFERIRKERETAADLLSLMSFFNSQGIPDSTLRTYSRDATRINDSVNNFEDNDVDEAFEKDFDTLHSYSLVSTAIDTETCKMHPLVQFCTRVWMSMSSTADYWQQTFIDLMARELPDTEPENRTKSLQLLPHLEPLFATEPASGNALKAWSQVLTVAAFCLYQQGRYSTAYEVATKALKARESALGADDLKSLETAELLGFVLCQQGKFVEARELQQRVLDRRREKLGDRHRDTMDSISNLANAYLGLREYEVAEALHRQALQAFEESLGLYNSRTLVSMGNLAVVLKAQRRYTEAEKFARDALRGWEKLPHLRSYMFYSMYTLADALQAQGNYDAAAQIYEQTLRGEREQLGDRHPDTLATTQKYASLLLGQGKFEDAETLQRQLLNIREQELGPRHPDTLYTVWYLAALLPRLNRKVEAVELYQRAYEGLVDNLGAEHPDTIACYRNLGALQRDIAEAEAIDQPTTSFGKRNAVWTDSGRGAGTVRRLVRRIFAQK